MAVLELGKIRDINLKRVHPRGIIEGASIAFGSAVATVGLEDLFKTEALRINQAATEPRFSIDTWVAMLGILLTVKGTVYFLDRLGMRVARGIRKISTPDPLS